jgi:tetratricopeptide (TPR) repeat protein
MTAAAEHTSETCLRMILAGVQLRKRDDPRTAERAFLAALMSTHVPGPAGSASENLGLRALALYNLSLLHLRHHRDKAGALREQATAFLTTKPDKEPLPPQLMPLFQELMAEVLVELGEYRRAIPYCEASIQFQVNASDSAAVAESLWRAGRCYARIGMPDHAAIPLRASAKIFRSLTGDPRFPVVLLELGNALRKSTPAEAEQCYREVAELHVSQAHLESATPAWVNLGVLCSEQARYAESLEYYERALRVREQSRGTPPERIGSLLNNMAGVRRRMGQFPAALDLADRAIRLLESGGHYLACAFGTRGMILRDAGSDAEAVEWFRKSAAEHQKQPSPNLDTLAEELENEAAALERLGRTNEAGDARQRLESVRVSIAGIKSVEGPDWDGLKAVAGGAVLIEVAFGSRAEGANARRAFPGLRQRLADALKEQGTGYYGGWVAIPESTTFMLYGGDAEALLSSVEPLLRAEPMCSGARITVRQGSRHRELVLPGRVN